MSKRCFGFRLWLAEQGPLAGSFLLCAIFLGGLFAITVPVSSSKITGTAQKNSYRNEITGNQYLLLVKSSNGDLAQVHVSAQSMIAPGATVCLLKQRSVTGKTSYLFSGLGRCI